MSSLYAKTFLLSLKIISFFRRQLAVFPTIQVEEKALHLSELLNNVYIQINIGSSNPTSL
jgi:hypothetical protein